MILFLAQNDFFTKENNGGLAITRRNYQILCNIFGKENVEVAVIAPDNSSFGFQSNPKLIWLEGNLRGLKTTINELFNHTYISCTVWYIYFYKSLYDFVISGWSLSNHTWWFKCINCLFLLVFGIQESTDKSYTAVAFC